MEEDHHPKLTEVAEVVATVMAESTNADVTTLTNMNDSYTCLTSDYEDSKTSITKVMKMRRFQGHGKTYSPKWEEDPNYRGWVSRSKKGSGFYYCLACNQDYTCGKSELDKHASSRKHCLNVSMNKAVNNDQYSIDCTNLDDVQYYKCDYDMDPSFLMKRNAEATSSKSTNSQSSHLESKEESFGKYIISEMKRIKKRKTYELVKWEILQALQKAMLEEAEAEYSEE